METQQHQQPAQAIVSTEDLSTWRRRISKVQSSNCSHEQIQALRARAAAAQRRGKAKKKASRIQRCHAVQQRSWNTAMKSFADVEAAAAPNSSLMMAEVSQEAHARMDECQKLMRRRASDSDEDEDEAEAAMHMISHEMALDVHDEAVLAVEVEADISEMDALLMQLRVEPADEAQVHAKFGLFEKYLETVETTRATLLQFWGESKDEFPASGQHAVEASIKKIDGEDNLGIEFVEGRWFVFDMTKKAGQNNSVIGRVLQSIKTKLDLLSRDEECPICLERLEKDETRVLDCCHKVCTPCWEHWNRLQGGRGWCPICRHDEFLSTFVANEDQP